VSIALLAAVPLVGLLLGPAYATLAWIFGALRLAAARKWPAPDLRLLALAGTFCVLCVAASAFSIAPAHSVAAAGQLALIFAASLVVLADRSLPPAAAGRAFGAMSLALFAGVAVMCADHALHFRLEHALDSHAAFPGTKYNRGEDYLTLLLWPLLAFWTLDRRYGRAALVAGAVGVAVLVGLSTTALVTLPVGVATLLAASLAPRTTRRVLAGVTVLMAVTLPFLLRTLAADRALFWRHLKLSGLHRLEIWDYMTARVFERPWLGWGLSTAKSVPIRPSEQLAYRFVDPHGVYPHNQWLQLWVETGAAGVLLGVLFALLVLRRIGEMPPRLAPFACAAFATAMAVSSSSFEITTDSWWAALALTALLLRLAGQVALP
jgi:O-antigen ligase